MAAELLCVSSLQGVSSPEAGQSQWPLRKATEKVKVPAEGPPGLCPLATRHQRHWASALGAPAVVPPSVSAAARLVGLGVGGGVCCGHSRFLCRGWSLPCSDLLGLVVNFGQPWSDGKLALVLLSLLCGVRLLP